jgi:hypothetical protein
MEETVSWYKGVESGDSASALTRKQIINYMGNGHD